MAVQHSFECDHLIGRAKYKESIRANKESLQGFVDQGVLSKYMADKFASNGHNLNTLKNVKGQNSFDGFASSLDEVTKRTDILTNLFEALTINSD